MKSFSYLTLILFMSAFNIQAMNNNNHQVSKKLHEDYQNISNALNTILISMPLHQQFRIIGDTLIETTKTLFRSDMNAIQESLKSADNTIISCQRDIICPTNQCVARIESVRGKLSDIARVDTTFYVLHCHNGGTPSDIRTHFINIYTHHSHAEADRKHHPRKSNEQINSELAQLKAVTLQCTKKSITKLVNDNFAQLPPDTINNPVAQTTIAQMPTLLLQGACVNYFNALRPLRTELSNNFLQ